jgi:ribonuclease R
MYRAFLMRDRVGEQYEGTIAGVAGFGMFVQIESPFIEGLVKADSIGDDFYDLDEAGIRLCGRRTGRVFQLGDKVRVRVENVSVQRRKIDLALEEHLSQAAPARPYRPQAREPKARAGRSAPVRGRTKEQSRGRAQPGQKPGGRTRRR